MRSFTRWRALFSGVFLGFLMLTSGQSMGQFVEIGTPSGTSNTNFTYPTPFGNYYWGARQQYFYPASEISAAGLAAGDITAIRFNVTSTNGAVHNGYNIKIKQTSATALDEWETGLTTVYGPVNQTPVLGYNTFNFSTPFNWDGISNIVIEVCFSNTGYTQNSHVEWSTTYPYNVSRTYRADSPFASNGGCAATLNSNLNQTLRPMTEFEGTFASCPPPFDVAVSSIGESSADISWTGTGGDVYLEYGAPGFTPGSDATAGGGTVIGPLAGGTYNLGGLSPQTDYQVYLREECTPGSWSLNNVTTFTTTCSIFPAPFFEDFEGITATQTTSADQFPNCWSNLGANFWYVRNSQSNVFPAPDYDIVSLAATDNTTGSGSYIWMDGSVPAPPIDDGINVANNEVITPPIDISGLTTPYLSLWVGKYYTGTFGQTELKVYAWDGSDWELLIAYNAQNNDSWTELTAVLPGTLPAITQIRLVAWNVSGSAFYDNILVDDIYVGEAPTCLTPNNVVVDAFSISTADISWDCAGCTGDFYVEYGAPGFIPGTGAAAGGGTVVGPIVGNSTQITGLSANTDYAVRVRQDCGLDGFSFNSGTASFYTGSCNDGGPSTVTDTNVGEVEMQGLGASGFTFDHCAPPGGPDLGYTGVLNQTALSASVAEGFPQDLTVEWAACDNSTYGAQGAVWIDWNSNLVFEPGELIGTTSSYPATDVYSVSPPPGTALGPKTMRVMLQEGGIQPLDPCGSFFYGSVTDFTVEVVAPPACTQIDADFNLLADCPNDQFSIEVEVIDVTDSPGGVVNITNTGGEPDLLGVGVGTYVVGPFAAGTNVTLNVEHLGDPVCSASSGSQGTDCIYCAGGPSNTADSNVNSVTLDGLGTSDINHVSVCPGIIGVQDLTAQSADVSEIIQFEVEVEYGGCGSSCYGGAGTVWVDWNGDAIFSNDEVVGSDSWLFGACPLIGSYTFTAPPGTALGPKTMRVMQWEGGSLPLNPCGSFTWGSVMDFTLNVVAPPDCSQPVADFSLLADCGNSQFSIEVDLTDVGDSPGGVVNIINDGGAAAEVGVGVGTYVIGPFIAGTNVTVTIENLGDALCNVSSGALGTTCILCAGGPTSTFDSNVELVEISGFAGSGFSHAGCNPAVAGVEDLTALTVDIPNGFSYDVQVDLGTCGGVFGGVGSAWVDWNGDFQFTQDELIGSSTIVPSTNFWSVTPPPGTPIGPKTMRVMQWEGGSLPLDPCGSFSWGSVMDFTVNVIADPGCLPAQGSVALNATSCDAGSFEFGIDVTITSTGDSPGGEVTISNSYDGTTIPNATVGGGPYYLGPFPSGASVTVFLEHGSEPLCNAQAGNITHDCPPPNDDCANATPLTLNQAGECMGLAVSASTGAASTDGPTATCLITGLTDVWFSFSTGSSPYVNWEITLGTMEAIGVEIWDVCGGTSLYCLADQTTDFVTLEANSDYLFRVLTIPQFAGSFDICLEAGPDSPAESCTPEYSSTLNTLDVLGPIPGGDIITDLDVVVNVQYPNIGDLLIELESPCGTVITLQDQECEGGENMDAYFDDSAVNDFVGFCEFRIGEVQPQQALLTFNNEPIIGTWTLSVTNAGNPVPVNSWCLVPTLDDGCPPPPVAITGFTDTSISVDVGANPCYAISNYESYTVDWGTGSESGITTLPYTITGLDPGTNYNISFSGVCTGGIPSGSTGVSQYTLNCSTENVCTYELTLTNNDGTGFENAFVQVNNGWSTADYTLSSGQSTNTFIINACPGNPLSVSLSNGGDGALASQYNVTLVNASEVEVYNENGPEEALLYFTTDGCPDCASVQNIGTTRIASDLVDVSWTNVEILGNVDDILVEVYIDDLFGSILIGSVTVPAGSTTASVPLNAEYPFSDVFVQITTNCTNEGAGIGTSNSFQLPGCAAADQCEYVFDMTSSDDGWMNNALAVLIDGATNIEVSLESGTSGSQSIYACEGGTIDVTALTNAAGGGIPSETCINTTPYITATIPNSGNVVTISTCTFAGEYNTVNLGSVGTYEFTSSSPSDYLTFTDGSNNVIAAGPTPLEVVISATGAHRLHINSNSSCGTESACRTTTGQFIGSGSAACNTFTYSLTLNPLTDNVELLAETDFCDYEDGDIVYSAATCPSCFAPVDAAVADVSSTSVDVTWFSNNPAGTDFTIYVGLPGFTPGVDEVATTSGVTAATGAQGPETVSGLLAYTDYQAVVIEDCDSGNDPSDLSNTVTFITLIDNDDCADVTPADYTAPATLVLTGSSVGANDNSFNQSYGAAQAWEAIELTACASNVVISLCGSTPAPPSAFTGISTGCPAVFPGNYLFADDFDFVTCGDDNVTLYYDQLLAGTYWIPVYEGTEYTLTITSDECEGCTDPAAINYDPIATLDDGSCIIPDCSFPTLTTTINNDCLSGTYTVDLEIGTNGDASNYDVFTGGECDITVTMSSLSWGDATTWTLTDNDGAAVLSGGPYGNGYSDTQSLTGADNGPYTLTIVSTLGDNTPNYIVEVDGSVEFSGAGTANSTTVVGPIECGGGSGGNLVGTFNGGDIVNLGPYNIGSSAQITVVHNDDATCNQTISVSSSAVCGCTDPMALNYDPSNTEDDGSCILPACINPPTSFSYCYPNNANESFYFAPNTPGDEIIITINQGSVESNSWDNFTVYDGDNAGAPVLFSNPNVTVSLVGLVIESTNGNGLFITVTSDGSVSCGAGNYSPIVADVYCGFLVIEGCTDANAVNYDPEATVDDGTCLFAPDNDECVNATPLTPVQYPNTQNTLGTLTAATTNGSSACVGINGPDVFYSFNVPFENHYWVNLNPFSGFAGVVEVLDACDGTVVACENAPPSAPFCNVAQSTPGFSSDPDCEAAICASDSFCCNNSWDSACASAAATNANCVNCLSTASAGSGPISIFIENLAAGDYIVRIRDYNGVSYSTPAQFLVNVQYFPVGQVQSNPANFMFACDQTVQLEDLIGASPQTGQLPGVMDYEWWIAEEGGTFQNFWVRLAPNYATKPDWLGMEYAGITYNVFVRLLLDLPDQGPTWGVFPQLDADPHAVGASLCTITTSNDITLTEVNPNWTPTNAQGNAYAMCNVATALTVANAEDYEWEFSDGIDPPVYYTRGAGNPSVKLSWVECLKPNTTYNVRVRAQVNGIWANWGPSRIMDMAPTSFTAVRPNICNTTRSINQNILPLNICIADQFEYELTNVNTLDVHTIISTTLSGAGALNSATPPLVPGETYSVRVKATQCGVEGDFSTSCDITILGPQAEEEGMAAQRDLADTGSSLFPNPNAGSEVRLELRGISDGPHDVHVVIYDIYGKMISTSNFGHEGTDLSRLIRFDENLAMGMYMVHVLVDGEQFAVERMVVK